MSHLGVRLKVTSPSGDLLDLDSDHLHMVAKIANGDDWHEIFPGDGMAYHSVNGPRDLVISVQPVELPDEYPED